jgi:uncharacterized membrane protein
MNSHIHEVKSVEIRQIETQEISTGLYSTRKIIIQAENGLEFELVLFAALRQHLEITL